MKRKELVLAVISSLVLSFLFFYKTIVFGQVPFPGDSLVSDFQPWRSASYLGYNPGSYPNKAQYPDTLRQMYPWKTQVIDALKKGRLPLWNPYNFSGAPLLANFQSQALYPLNIFYLPFSHIDAWTLLVIVQPLLAAFFTYVYARKIRLNPYGAALAAISFGYSGFMAVWLEYNTVGHVILWLPLALLALEHIREKPSGRWIAVLIFAEVSSLLGGHPQIYAYGMVFRLIYALFRLPKRFFGYVGAAYILAFGISALQIIPGIGLIQNAARAPHEFTNLITKILIQPWQLFTLPFPNFFGNPATRSYWPDDTFVGKVLTIGLVPLFFLPSAVRKKDGLTFFFAGAAGIVLILVTANPLTYVLYRIPIPLFTSSSPTLMTFLLAFSLSLLCGIGLDYWITDKHSVKKLVVRTIETLTGIAALILLAKSPFIPALHEHAAPAIRALTYAAMISVATMALFFLFIRFKKLKNLSLFGMILLSAADLLIFFLRFNPFVPKTFVFPNHPVLSYLQTVAPMRYWGYGTARIDANYATQYSLFSPEGYDPLYPIWYGSLLYSYRNGTALTVFDTKTRSDAAIDSGFDDRGLGSGFKKRMLDLLSVRYILDRPENASSERNFPVSSFTKSKTIGDWTVFENIHAAPRAFIASSIRYADTAKDISSVLFDAAFIPDKTAVVPSGLSFDAYQNASGTAAIVSYEPENVAIKTVTGTDALLVLTDTFDPDWIASIDGRETGIVPVDLALRGVVVPKGTHTVLMRYKPQSVQIGIYVSIISSIGAVIYILVLRKKFR